MENLDKILVKKTIYINGSDELEKFRDMVINEGHSGLMGYDDSYKDEKVVNTGYMHCEMDMFYLSKERFEKELISFNDLLTDMVNDSY